MANTYEAPEVRELGTVEELTRDGIIIKVGTESDAFTSLAPDVTGSNVTINPPTG